MLWMSGCQLQLGLDVELPQCGMQHKARCTFAII